MCPLAYFPEPTYRPMFVEGTVDIKALLTTGFALNLADLWLESVCPVCFEKVRRKYARRAVVAETMKFSGVVWRTDEALVATTERLPHLAASDFVSNSRMIAR